MTKDPRRHTLANMATLATTHGGHCIAEEYINNGTKIRWRCAEGHEFDMAPNRVQQHSWCPICARGRAGGTQRLTIEEIRQSAEERGGKLLTERYKNNRTPMLWECGEGHTWSAGAENIRSGKWCPQCSVGVSEQICRAILENAFDRPFPKTRPKWLLNERNNRMELDGYCEELRLAFEYNGKQHYVQVDAFHKEKSALVNRIADDARKVGLCLEQGVNLIVIPYTVKRDDLGEFFHEKCKTFGIKEPIENFAWNYTDVYHFYADKLAALQKLAKGHQGRCLSQRYIESKTKLRFECANGHTWFAYSSNILKGVWCQKCATVANAEKLRKYDMRQIQKIASERGGHCLSKECLNAQTILLWECAKKHQWETKLSHVISGSWCSKCAKAGKHAKYDIEHFKTKARDRGGECLSNEYKGITGRLKWRCNEDHEWEAPAKSIQDGRWCSKCARKTLAKKFAKTIDDMRELARKQGGECLSNAYENTKSKLLWRCSEGHEWWSAAGNVISGYWCRHCGQKNRRRREQVENEHHSR